MADFDLTPSGIAALQKQADAARMAISDEAQLEHIIKTRIYDQVSAGSRTEIIIPGDDVQQFGTREAIEAWLGRSPRNLVAQVRSADNPPALGPFWNIYILIGTK